MISLHLQAGDEFQVVPGSEFVVSRTARKDNSSDYHVNGRKVPFKEVARLLKDCGIDLDHNRFLILQVSYMTFNITNPFVILLMLQIVWQAPISLVNCTEIWMSCFTIYSYLCDSTQGELTLVHLFFYVWPYFVLSNQNINLAGHMSQPRSQGLSS